MYPNPYEQNPYDQRQAGSGGNTNPPQNPQNPPQNPPSGPNPYGPPYQQTAYGNQGQGQYTPPPPPPSNPQWDSTVRADDPSQYPAVPANPNQYPPVPANPNQYQQTVPSQYPQGTPGQYMQPGANQYAAPTMPNQFQPTPAPANQYQGGSFNQPPAPTKRPSSNMRLILIGLVAVLVIGGSLAAFFAVSAHNTQVAHDNATATANVQATSTSIANTQATGTAVAQAATANAQASATAVASVYPFSATVKLDDPLTDNSKNVNWKTSNNCQFTGGAYHVIVPDAKTFIDCYASNTNYTDFTYQVTMQILKGDFGGITIRGDSANFKYYAFAISSDGAYAIELYSSAANPTELDSGTIANFQTGAANTVGVVARGTSLTLYVNNQQAASVTDNTYTGGQIGCIAYNIQNYGDVAFSNAKVWGLTQTQ